MSEDIKWHSPLHALSDAQAKRRTIADAEIVEAMPDNASEKMHAQQVGVCDLSPLPRIGGKGVCNASVPAVNHAVAVDNKSGICIRLGEDELLILSDDAHESAKIASLNQFFDKVHCPILRRESHCQIGLCGAQADLALAEMCAVPPPSSGEIAQTIVADVGALVVGVPDASYYYILADSGYAVHVWQHLLSAVTRLGGGVIGWQMWRSLRNNKSNS